MVSVPEVQPSNPKSLLQLSLSINKCYQKADESTVTPHSISIIPRRIRQGNLSWFLTLLQTTQQLRPKQRKPRWTLKLVVMPRISARFLAKRRKPQRKRRPRTTGALLPTLVQKSCLAVQYHSHPSRPLQTTRARPGNSSKTRKPKRWMVRGVQPSHLPLPLLLDFLLIQVKEVVCWSLKEPESTQNHPMHPTAWTTTNRAHLLYTISSHSSPPFSNSSKTKSMKDSQNKMQLIKTWSLAPNQTASPLARLINIETSLKTRASYGKTKRQKLQMNWLKTMMIKSSSSASKKFRLCW